MGLNPSCNRRPDQRPGFPVLGDPPFRCTQADIACSELRAVGLTDAHIETPSRMVEVFVEGSEADQLGRRGIYLPGLDSPTEKIAVYEVRATLGKYQFRRAWYYWIVKGPVPLEVAKEMYAAPEGRHDVRAGGHCGAPPPETQVHHIAPDGKPAILKSEMDEYRGTSVEERLKDKVTEMESFDGCEVYVETYHIDTPEGLRLYVDTLRKHGLVQP